MNTRTNKYWANRAQEQLTLVEKQAEPYLKSIDKIYLDAQRSNLEEVKKLYTNYYKKQGWDTAKLNAIAPKGDIRRFQQAVARAGLETVLPTGYGFRLTRYELIEANIWLQSKATVAQQLPFQTAAHRQTIETGYRYALYNLSKGTGVAPAFSDLPTRTIDAMLDSTFYGKNYSQRVYSSTDKLAGELRGILTTATTTGQSQTKTAKLVRERYGVRRFEAARLVQTETNHFNTMASMESFREVGLDEWIFIATLDGRTGDICANYDGQRYPVGSGPMPPIHPNCVLPETVVLAPEAHAMTKSEYSGDVIKISTALGRSLRLTPNHIVLTARGWVAAKNIVKTDKIIDYKGWGEVSGSNPADNNGVASVENLFASLGESGGVSTTTMPATTEHLKGDVVVDSEIKIVYTNGLLRDIADTSFVHLLSDTSLVDTLKTSKAALNGRSSLSPMLSGLASAADGLMSSESVSLALFGGSTSGQEPISLCTASQYDARLSQVAVNNVPADAELFSDRINAVASLIEGDKLNGIEMNNLVGNDTMGVEPPIDSARTTTVSSGDTFNGFSRFMSFDNVVDVEVGSYSGHVYDLSTMSSLYIANGIVTSNCRCTEAAYLGREYEPDERIMRDPKTGKNRYISNLSFSQWQGLYDI